MSTIKEKRLQIRVGPADKALLDIETELKTARETLSAATAAHSEQLQQIPMLIFPFVCPAGGGWESEACLALVVPIRAGDVGPHSRSA